MNSIVTIGGLKFFRKMNCGLKLVHQDDEFISQFLRIGRANSNTWPVALGSCCYYYRCNGILR